VEDMYEVSDVLQNEIAHLDQRFKVQLDPVQQFGNKTIKLICQLDDKTLPSVPPITVTVPENYPESPPLYSANKVQYASTTFYVNVLSALKVHMNKMPSQFSVTALLDTWEMCVRQTCSTMLPSLRSPAKAWSGELEMLTRITGGYLAHVNTSSNLCIESLNHGDLQVLCSSGRVPCRGTLGHARPLMRL